MGWAHDVRLHITGIYICVRFMACITNFQAQHIYSRFKKGKGKILL